jgi:hypothetical protein
MLPSCRLRAMPGRTRSYCAGRTRCALGLGISLVAAVLTVLAGLSFECEECEGPAIAIGVVIGVLLLGVTVWDASRWRRGADELRVDRDSFWFEGGRVPWEAVMSVLWNAGSGGEGGSAPFVEVRVRTTESYRPPRSGIVAIPHGEYRIEANTLIDLLETAALPLRITVLAIDPPPRSSGP